MNKTLMQAGAQSATWLVTEIDASFVAFTSTDWAQLPAGKLKDTLTQPYLNSGDQAAKEALFNGLGDAGLRGQTIGTYNTGATSQTDVVFDFDVPIGQTGPVGAAVLFFAPDPSKSMIVNMSVAYSVEA